MYVTLILGPSTGLFSTLYLYLSVLCDLYVYPAIVQVYSLLSRVDIFFYFLYSNLVPEVTLLQSWKF